ncbi:NUDIX hydrolase [Lentibacter algarum]|uniref:NUDIX domain-containing protein n=1 Tax=Lentibacter algarum TaxID=576131 RepID=UPI001C068ABE|nr:NUDIX hydrolase [Lentibacter algarum]MBU2980937.1 NUDIX hydrolase [Lentibacter algarum]
MPRRPIRLATRAIILVNDELLMVNAWPQNRTESENDLWCAPGGGADPHHSLPENLAREVHEETGLTVTVGAPCMVNEFHAPERSFHQVDIYFRCTVISGQLSEDWQDPEHIVTRRKFFSRDALKQIRFKPDSLPDVAWGDGFAYDPLEPLVR